MVFSFASLAAVVALAGWYDRSVALHAAEDHVESTVGLLQQHALNVFQTQTLVHEQIRLRVAGLIGRTSAAPTSLRAFFGKCETG